MSFLLCFVPKEYWGFLFSVVNINFVHQSDQIVLHEVHCGQFITPRKIQMIANYPIANNYKLIMMG